MLSQNEIRTLEEKKLLAIGARDASTYARIVDQLGIKPELADLYEQGVPLIPKREPYDGTVEHSGHEAEDTGLEKTVQRETRGRDNVAEFLSQADGMLVGNLGAQTANKEALLRAHFKRFQLGESQDLSRYGPIQIGSIFQRLYHNYDRKR